MTDVPYLTELPYCDSTNDELRSRPRMLRHHGMAFFTLDQRNGRGRLGRRWLSPPGNLALSATLHAPDLKCASLVPVIVGLAVYRVLAEFANKLTLKWPNDILRDGKKIGGILCESISGILHPPALAVIAGIGINLHEINSADFQAASLAPGGLAISGSEIAHRLATALRTTNLQSSLTPDFIAEWNQAAALPARFLYGSHNKIYTGLTLQPDGRLQAELDGKVVFLESGEILLSPADN